MVVWYVAFGTRQPGTGALPGKLPLLNGPSRTVENAISRDVAIAQASAELTREDDSFNPCDWDAVVVRQIGADH